MPLYVHSYKCKGLRNKFKKKKIKRDAHIFFSAKGQRRINRFIQQQMLASNQNNSRRKKTYTKVLLFWYTINLF